MYMKKIGLLILGGVLVLVFLVGGALVGLYNRLVTLDQEVANKQGQIEVVLQRRFDLIPNLVASTQGFLKQEQTVFADIANARTKYSGASAGTSEKLSSANELEGALSRLLVIVESYPTLKSDQTVKDLMTELAGSENRIAVERQRYNDSVTTFNTFVRTFPNTLFAGIFGFESKSLFEAVSDADIAPKVTL